MLTNTKESSAVGCENEYAPLRRVILCPPRFMEIKEVINEVQENYKDENIDIKKALEQHSAFVKALEQNGIETVLLKPATQFPEQVFTRDIAFTIGEKVFLGSMASEIRKGEEKNLKQWLENQRIAFEQLSGTPVEGGDVLLDRAKVFVGISSRTSEQAIQELEQNLPNHRVLPIPFDDKYLHLDCVFNILSPTEALVFPEAFSCQTINLLAEHYDLIRVSREEQFSLGVNVLSIGNKHVFSQPQNVKVNQQLISRGYRVIEIDFSEIIKSGGAFRCCTMPLVRE
ncbi:dimethylarginine dimethylaminohydrolase family protein [Planococcus shixiaomingii]|uniref:dimethylarginine dimethylaminohydrolase family protein n=1 Tax=Planococcus shixiaomingii TaxID=3058393 RepID=UPI002602DAA7|nr:dimethylarginine dimethylaminohydrolase family protein [Planococcus sp. N022]WKA55053.1 dimethylarginine dimethylaminohydrolase family protein [Planococcus sp. N022]